MDRRRFLQMCGGGLVATATMQEVGFFAEFMAWLKKKPTWFIPSKPAIVNCTVEQYADWISMSGSKTGYGTYVIGQDAVFSVSLGATEIPEQRNFQITVRNWEPSVADPARVVGASAAYNFKYAAMRVPQNPSLNPRHSTPLKNLAHYLNNGKNQSRCCNTLSTLRG